MAERRPLLSSMDDDYASYALSQRMAFERTFPTALAAAREMHDAPVLRVLDQGAADGRNSHALMRDLLALRDGRPLAYSFVDMPGNPWTVATEHLMADAVLGAAAKVVPEPGDPLGADVGTGPHAGSADAHAAAVDGALAAGAALAVGMAGIPLHTAPSVPDGSANLVVSGTTMHWVEAPTDLGATGSVFPGYPGHADATERAAWADAAAHQWLALLRMRARELAPGGVFVAALPAAEADWPERKGLYWQVVGDMNDVLAEWVREGRIAQSTADAVVVPVWMRTPDEIRAPFAAGDGQVDGLQLEHLELFRLDNPYWDDDPAVFADRFMRSCLAWGRPLFEGAFAREGADRTPGVVADFMEQVRQRVQASPDRFRWDYLEALVVCRKQSS